MTQRCNSYYTATLNQDTDYPTLQGRHKVDVVIIGGGFTGVATAVELAEKGLKVAIVESHKIGWGATGRNGRQVTGSLSGDEAIRKQMPRTHRQEGRDFIWKQPRPPAAREQTGAHGRLAQGLRRGGAPWHGR